MIAGKVPLAAAAVVAAAGRAAAVRAAAVVLLAAALAACGSRSAGPAAAPVGKAGGPIAVVAAESQYGNVAAQVGGRYARVTSVISNPATDPHSYEISTSVARRVAAARVIVQNGLGYDGFMGRIESAAPGRHRQVIVVQKLLHLPDSTPNPHLWYAPAAMPAVADAVAAALGAVQPAHAAYFDANAARFRASLRPWTTALARLREAHPGFPVATTEPVADYLLQAAGARILTPYSFQADVMNGVDPAPQGLAAENDLLEHRRVRALIYNEQVTDSLTAGFVRTAHRSGVAVVGVSETMPAGDTYQQWMLSTVAAIEKAVGRP